MANHNNHKKKSKNLLKEKSPLVFCFDWAIALVNLGTFDNFTWRGKLSGSRNC